VIWFENYRANLLKKIYEGSPWGGSDKLDALWPFFVGGAVFAAFDIGLGLDGAVRWGLLSILVAPGVAWLAYVSFHEIQALRLWLKRRKEIPENVQ
jgi:hypothetical protein